MKTSYAGGRHNMPPPVQVDLQPNDLETLIHGSAHSTWSMTVSSSLPPVDVNFDRQTSIAYVCHSMHSLSSRRSLLRCRCRWTTSVKQSPCRTSPHQTLHRTVP